MNDERKLRRVETLLAISRTARQAAQQAFDEVRGQADELKLNLAKLERAMIAQHQAARQRLVEDGQANFAGSYREGISTLRRQISQLVARQKNIDTELENHRANLVSAMTRHKAAKIVHDKLLASKAEHASRLETRQLDEAHAAIGSLPGSAWRQGDCGLERHRR